MIHWWNFILTRSPNLFTKLSRYGEIFGGAAPKMPDMNELMKGLPSGMPKLPGLGGGLPGLGGLNPFKGLGKKK